MWYNGQGKFNGDMELERVVDKQLRFLRFQISTTIEHTQIGQHKKI
jgi:hypothetical protein